MSNGIKSVTFTPQDYSWAKVVAIKEDGSKETMFLDMKSTKYFLQLALQHGSVSPP